MALQKTIEKKGYDTTYSRIIVKTYYALANRTEIQVAHYKDRAARIADQTSFIDRRKVAIDGRLNMADAYTHLKTLDEFTGATDVLE